VIGGWEKETVFPRRLCFSPLLATYHPVPFALRLIVTGGRPRAVRRDRLLARGAVLGARHHERGRAHVHRVWVCDRRRVPGLCDRLRLDRAPVRNLEQAGYAWEARLRTSVTKDG
jgi:hypothetical protein